MISSTLFRGFEDDVIWRSRAVLMKYNLLEFQ